MPRRPKFDYDGDDFYDEVLALAMQGMTDAEIADALADKLGDSLSPERFNCMKNGTYEAWTEEENKQRGERLCKVLARGRRPRRRLFRAFALKCNSKTRERRCPPCPMACRKKTLFFRRIAHRNTDTRSKNKAYFRENKALVFKNKAYFLRQDHKRPFLSVSFICGTPALFL